MNFSVFKEIATERRSVRKYQDQPVARELIEEIIDLARYAPSATNSQTWYFLVVDNKARIKEIAAIMRNKLELVAADAESKELSKRTVFLIRSFTYYATAFENAPVVIIAAAPPYKSKFREILQDLPELGFTVDWDKEAIKSNALACQNIMLAAQAHGLATCPFTGPIIVAGEELTTLLGLPADYEINMLISLGYPAESPKMPKRKPLGDVISYID